MFGTPQKRAQTCWSSCGSRRHSLYSSSFVFISFGAIRCRTDDGVDADAGDMIVFSKVEIVEVAAAAAAAVVATAAVGAVAVNILAEVEEGPLEVEKVVEEAGAAATAAQAGALRPVSRWRRS